MQREWLVIAVLIGIVLLPMWFVALQSEPHPQEVAIDQSVTHMQPLAGFVDAPNKLTPSQVGVIVWVALFGLLATLTAVHRFMNRAVRPPDATADGGAAYPWLTSAKRQIVEYRTASEDINGVVVMGGLTMLAIVFAALFTGEYLTLARTQYFGIYAAGMFLSLTLLTVAYYAWFLPHVTVAEERGL
jgi:hypothetical protein